jgi:hypothetical protein
MREKARRRPRERNRGLTGKTALLAAAVAVQLALAPAAGQPQRRPPRLRRRRLARCKKIAIVLARELRDRPPPLSLLDFPPQDDGVAGRGSRSTTTTPRGASSSRSSRWTWWRARLHRI